MDGCDANSDPLDTGTTENSMSKESTDTGCLSSSSSSTKNIETELLKVIPGKAAVCVFCGNTSIILNKCDFCKRTLPDTVKIVLDGNAKKNTVHSALPAPIGANVLVRKGLTIQTEKIHGKPPPRSLNPIPNLSSLDTKRKRCSTPRKPKVKVPEEPEILTLSSDDEDKQVVKPNKKVDRESELLANGSFSGVGLEPGTEVASAMDAANNAEESRQNSVGVQAGGLLEQAVEGSMSSPFFLIVCRTIRIGTFRVKPSERVVISSQGLEIKVPLQAGPEVTINVPMSYIERVLVSFCRSMPVLFLYLKREGGVLVRQILNMKDPKSSYYFDPQSSDDTQKRITILPEKITEDQKRELKRIFDGNKVLLTEIENSLANDILVRSSPPEVRLRLSLPGNEIQTIMVYPPPPAKGGISINTEDYACLGEDQFLNDVIIDFYLKYLMQCVLSEEDRERTHVFSTFFYKRLTCKPKKGRRHPVEDDPNLTPAQKRHARVKGWTKSVNLFSKDFIIIPINENCHWFLAIICYPGQDGCLRMSDNTPIDLPKPPSTTVAAAVAAAAAAATTHSKLKVKDNVMSIGSTTITPVRATPAATITLDQNGEEGSDRDEAEGDEEEMNDNSDEEDSGHVTEDSNGSKDMGSSIEGSAVASSGTPPPSSTLLSVGTLPVANSNPLPKRGKPVVREGIKQPCILIFDSLVGAPRYRVAATLREYLSIEYKVKEKKDKEFSKDTIKGMLPKVPQQTNFTDCGLYLLQYAEMFFKDPIRDYHAPIKQLNNWFPEEVVSRKREDIVNLLKDLMREQNIDPNSMKLPQLTFNYSTQSTSQQTEDEEAQARLTAADSEADDQASQASNLTPMEDMNCENEVTVPHSTTEEVSSSKSENVECGAINNGKSTEPLSSPRLNQSLVDYSESSNDSSSDNSVMKRSQSEVDAEDIIEKKKRKAD